MKLRRLFGDLLTLRTIVMTALADAEAAKALAKRTHDAAEERYRELQAEIRALSERLEG